MRKGLFGGVVTACLFMGAQDLLAQPCTPGPGQLGVSRIVEVDTASGPRFGGKKSEFDFLEDGEVILTFDDGPLRSHTRAVLAALDAHCAKATFFLVGKMAVADPEMVKEYDRRGHTVGSHTWSHANLTQITPLKARHEVELGFSAVQAALGKPIAPFFRFPYLAEPRSMVLHLQGRHVSMFNIDIDSKDYRIHDAASMHRKVMTDLAVKRKGIILFHDIQASTARGLKGLLDDLQTHKYRIVHIVPKTPATTDPELDTIASKALARRHLASAGNPLSRRAVTWPAVVSSEDDGAGKPVAATSRARRNVQRPAPSEGGEQPPFSDFFNKLFQ